MRTLRCPCCHASITTQARPGAGLQMDYRTGGLVISYAGRPIHSCDLERAQRAVRQAVPPAA